MNLNCFIGCFIKETKERFNIKDILRHLRKKEVQLRKNALEPDQPKINKISQPLEFEGKQQIPIKKKESLRIVKEPKPQNQEEEKKIEEVLQPPKILSTQYSQDLTKRERLNNIIIDLKNNKSFQLVYNFSELDRSGTVLWFNNNEIPHQYSSDRMELSSPNGVSLDNLDLGICDIELIRNLSETISYNSSIKRLAIQNDPTIANGNIINIQKLANAIFTNKNINILNLGSNQLGDGNSKNLECFFNAISLNTSINIFNLSNNILGNGNLKNIEIIFNSLASNRNINILNLSNNNLGEGNFKNIELIFNSISSNENIKELFLKNNVLGNGYNKNIEFIFSSISKNKRIKEMYLENNGWKENTKSYDGIVRLKKTREDISIHGFDKLEQCSIF